MLRGHCWVDCWVDTALTALLCGRHIGQVKCTVRAVFKTSLLTLAPNCCIGLHYMVDSVSDTVAVDHLLPYTNKYLLDYTRDSRDLQNISILRDK